MKRWKIGFCFGWFKSNPPVGFKVIIFEPIEDYPSGWMSVNLIGFMLGKLEVGMWLNKRELKP